MKSKNNKRNLLGLLKNTHYVPIQRLRYIVNSNNKKYKKRIPIYKKILLLQKQLNISDLSLEWMWLAANQKRSTIYNSMPKPVYRDNKDFLNKQSKNRLILKHSIRYPSKKRNKRVWRNFYKLFPHLAEKDGWNGEFSSKYNKQ